MKQFKPGQFAVYPGHGVGKVIRIESRKVLGNNQEFYFIEILDSGMKILVPCATSDSVGLRHVVDAETASKALFLARAKYSIDDTAWNRRYREYMEKIKTGDLLEVAEVIGMLSSLKVDKELSFGERKMLDTARSLLFRELAVVLGRDAVLEVVS